jgi:hypothetical protein
MLAERHPCRSRIKSPSHGQTSRANTSRGVTRLCHRSAMQITDHVGAAPHSVGQRPRGPNHSQTASRFAQHTWLTVHLAGRISWYWRSTPQVMALLLPGLLLIRAALSQQPSNNSLTFRLKRSCQMSRLARGPSRLRTFKKMPSEKKLGLSRARRQQNIRSAVRSVSRAAGHVFDT